MSKDLFWLKTVPELNLRQTWSIPCLGETEQNVVGFTVTCPAVWNSLDAEEAAMVKCYRELPGFQPRFLWYGEFLGYRLPADSYVCWAGAASWQLTRLEQGCVPHSTPPASSGEPHLNPSSQRLCGTNTITTVQLPHGRNRNAKECEWGEVLL